MNHIEQQLASWNRLVMGQPENPVLLRQAKRFQARYERRRNRRMQNGITTHHDGHGLNEKIVIEADDPGVGGASHKYGFWFAGQSIGSLQFQNGPRGEAGSTPGLTVNAVIAALVHHLQGFQSGPYSNRETACAITKLEEAMHWMRARADDRARRQVLGTLQK